MSGIIPTGCKQLSEMGHTLNGLYLVGNKIKNKKTGSKIEAAYCDFQAPNNNATGINWWYSIFECKNNDILFNTLFIEKRLGTVDVKSVAVEFIVTVANFTPNSQHYYRKNKIMFFGNILLNAGGGFDAKEQWFSAPRAGTYFFSISGYTVSGSDAENLAAAFFTNRNSNSFWPTGFAIAVALNNNLQTGLTSSTTGRRDARMASLSLQFTKKLAKGDKIEWYCMGDECDLYGVYLFFTGFLVNEDLNLAIDHQ